MASGGGRWAAFGGGRKGETRRWPLGGLGGRKGDSAAARKLGGRKGDSAAARGTRRPQGELGGGTAMAAHGAASAFPVRRSMIPLTCALYPWRARWCHRS